nr:MAG TPA: Flavivirus envelope glycoprotein M [Bacteriophage sp.]
MLCPDSRPSATKLPIANLSAFLYLWGGSCSNTLQRYRVFLYLQNKLESFFKKIEKWALRNE